MIPDETRKRTYLDEIDEELEPLFDRIRAKPETDYDLFRRAVLDFHKRTQRTLDIVELISNGGLAPGGPQHSLKDTIYNLFAYMGLVESVGNVVLDMVVMLLVANGRDFHIECQHTVPRVKHAVQIGDLEDERVPLTAKLNFLKENGIAVLASTIDSDLRNIIAHLKFNIKDNDILIRGRPCNEFILDSSRKLALALGFVIGKFERFAKEKGIFWEDQA
jgi:hypothetical protein